MEEKRAQNTSSSLQAGPAEVEHNSVVNMRVSRLIGRQLAQIGDEMDRKWQEQMPVQWPGQNLGVYSRRVFVGILNNLRGAKFVPPLRMFWLPQLQTGCQEVKKWAAWVSSVQVSEWSGRNTFVNSCALLLVSVSIFFMTRKESEG